MTKTEAQRIIENCRKKKTHQILNEKNQPEINPKARAQIDIKRAFKKKIQKQLVEN